MVARNAISFETPELEKVMKITVEGELAKSLFVDQQTRNGKYVGDQISRFIWEKHGLPMYRGTIVDAVPFRLRIERILIDFKNYGFAVNYRFTAE